MSGKEWGIFLSIVDDDEECEWLLYAQSKGNPERVQPAEQLRSDLNALKSFFDKDEPTWVCVWFKNCIQAVLAVRDASKKRFGDSFLSNEGISYLFGV